MSIFAALAVYQDETSRTAAMNMAIDEALLESAVEPSIRLYRWDHRALSFGYFGKYADVSAHAAGHDVVRRWTGGGIVFHGEDLTYGIVIPAAAGLFAASTRSVYAAIHGALCIALAQTGVSAELAQNESAHISQACFAHPVIADVMMDGLKIAGAAQRRTRHGLLQQGSIQQFQLAADLAARFVKELAPQPKRAELDESVLIRAEEIATQKYGAKSWLQKR
jgi:lipoate-protein ligase A